MKALTKGANAVLTRSGAVRVNLSWKASRIELDASCFAIDANGKTPNDAWFLFYNQPTSPGGAIQFSQPDARQVEFTIQLDQLPADIQKCIFAATLNQSNFSEVTNATITATPQNGETLQFKLSGATEEQALIFAEIYRHGPDWKMRAIGQGFKGGLQPLAEHYGIEIADEAVPPSQSEPASPPRPASDSMPDSPADRQQGAMVDPSGMGIFVNLYHSLQDSGLRFRWFAQQPDEPLFLGRHPAQFTHHAIYW